MTFSVAVLMFALLACQTRAPSSLPKSPVGPETWTSSVTVGAGGTLASGEIFGNLCVRVENCSPPADVPSSCGENLHILEGVVGCRLIVESFDFADPRGGDTLRIYLSPDESKALSNAREGDGVSVTFDVPDRQVFYSFFIRVKQRLPQQILGPITDPPSFFITYSRRGANEIEIVVPKS